MNILDLDLEDQTKDTTLSNLLIIQINYELKLHPGTTH